MLSKVVQNLRPNRSPKDRNHSPNAKIIENVELNLSRKDVLVHVFVEEATGLTNLNSASSGKSQILQGTAKTVSTICRVSIPQINRKFKTSAIKHSVDPIWNQFFSFRISPELIESAHVLFKISVRHKILEDGMSLFNIVV